MSAQHYQFPLSVFNENYSCISSLQPAMDSVWIQNFYVGFFTFFFRDYWREVSKLEMVASCTEFYTLRYQCWWSHVKVTGEFEKCWKVVFFSFQCEASECLLLFPGGAAGEMMMCSRLQDWNQAFFSSPQRAMKVCVQRQWCWPCPTASPPLHSGETSPSPSSVTWPPQSSNTRLPQVSTYTLTYTLSVHAYMCVCVVCVCVRERVCVCVRERVTFELLFVFIIPQAAVRWNHHCHEAELSKCCWSSYHQPEGERDGGGGGCLPEYRRI